METYQVSARKYRPATFESVVGQKALTATLKNAIATKRLAHSYLFCGSRGVGKTSCARIFAKTINCEHPRPDGEACNECESCRQFNSNCSMNIIEMDAASNNSVDNMRQMVDQVVVPPATGRYRVFIIDEVHMLSTQAFNAFLKTLEEPPAHVIFILATTEKHKIIPTILSRCQIYDFNPISIADMVAHLGYVAQQEGIAAEPSALGVIAQKADGAMRDALSIFDQVAASTRGNITYQSALDNLNVLDYRYFTRLTEMFLTGDAMASWLIYKEIRDKGFDSHSFVNGLAAYMRDLMVAHQPQTATLLNADPEGARVMTEVSAKCSTDFLLRAMSVLNECDLNYRVAANKQFLVELTLAKLCQLSSPSPVDDGQDEGLKLQPIARLATPATGAAQAMPSGTANAMPTQSASASPVPPPQASAQVAPAVVTQVRINPNPALRRGPSLKGHAQAQGGVSDTATATQSGQRRDSVYTHQALLDAWQSFVDSHPKQQILANTMRACTPQPAGGDGFRMMVPNAMQLETLHAAMPQINQWLRNALSNDNIVINVEVSEGPGEAYTWSDREVLTKMLENNSELAEFISAFNMKID